MKPEHLESLVWESLDGTISAKDRADLEEHIDRHPEAITLQREIEELAARLDGLGRAAPPTRLRPRIAAALEQVPAPARESSVSSFYVPSGGSARPSRTWFAMAASLLVGVTVGYLLQPGTGVAVDSSRAAGVMTTTSPGPASREMAIDLGEHVGSMTAGRRGDSTMIRIDLATATDLEIVLEVATGRLLPTGIDTLSSAGFEVVAGESKTVVRTRGPASHELKFTATEDAVPVHLIVRSNGFVVADDWLADETKKNRG